MFGIQRRPPKRSSLIELLERVAGLYGVRPSVEFVADCHPRGKYPAVTWSMSMTPERRRLHRPATAGFARFRGPVISSVRRPKVRRTAMIDPIRRKILKAGAAATVMAAAPRAFAQQTG